MSKKDNIKPVYLLAGPQALLIERFIDDIKSSLQQIHPNIQHFTYHTESDPIEEIIGNANNYSIFEEKKLIVVKKSEKLKKSDLAIIENYIDDPSGDCHLVFYSNETGKPKLKKHGNLETLQFKSEDQIEKRVINEAEMLGLKLTRGAVAELQKLIGSDLKAINNELLKITQYFTDKDKIEEGDIRDFITKRSNEDIFQLINSIAAKDRKSAVGMLNELRGVNYDPVSIVSTLSWRFRQMWHLKELQSTGINENELAKELKVSPGALYYLKKQSGKFSLNALSITMVLLSKLDKEIKSYGQDNYILISRFILRVCRN